MTKERFWKNPLAVAGIAVLCTLLWGSAFPCIKLGYEWFHIQNGDVPSMLLFAGGRFWGAGMIVLVIGLLQRRQPMLLRRSDLLPVGTLAFFQTFLQYLLLYIGIIHVSGTKSSLFTSLSAFGSVFLSAMFFRSDRLTASKIIGCLIGIGGIVIMNVGGSFGGFLLLGDGLVILSNLSGAAGNVVSKKIAAGRDPVQISAWQLLIGGSGLILTGRLLGGQLVFYDARCWWILLYLAAMAGIAFMLWTTLLFYNDVSRVAVFNLLIPVFGTMWSGIFLGENIFTPINLLSLALVCTGIFAVNLRQKPPSHRTFAR